jgi:hypothetical protein
LFLASDSSLKDHQARSGNARIEGDSLPANKPEPGIRQASSHSGCRSARRKKLLIVL